jgi:lipooligosaccharide transport system permease protein
MWKPFRIVQRNALVYRHTWRGSLFGSFVQPTMFLLAFGVGLGTLVDRGGAELQGGAGFLAFLAPGLLAGMCMNTAAFETTWPIAGKFLWQRNYEAISATPVRIADIVLGELVWVALRLLAMATTFVVVMSLFGAARSPLALLAVPAAVLTGLAFAAPILAFSGTVKGHANSFNVVFRFILSPLFLFSGIFFPITRLPAPLQTVAAFTPLFHGVALTRDLTLGTIDSGRWIPHVVYLALLTAMGAATAISTFNRALRP